MGGGRSVNDVIRELRKFPEEFLEACDDMLAVGISANEHVYKEGKRGQEGERI